MKQTKPPKKQLPTGIALVVVVVIVLILAVVWFKKYNTSGAVQWNSQQLADVQKSIDAGVPLPPATPRIALEKRGIKFPADYDQRVAKRAAELQGKGGGNVPGRAMTGIPGRTPRSGQ